MADIPAGWPCATLPAVPPSVTDREASPSADDLLPQVLALTPRGPAWGTDEAGDGSGASPVQRGFWWAIAAFVADHLGRDHEAARQTFPSGISYALPDWEGELGLPAPCPPGESGQAARIAAVRARFAAVGGQSPAYFVCLAKAAGYDIAIEEPTQFLVDTSEVIGGDPEETWFEVSGGGPVNDLDEIWFYPDDGACDDTPLEDYVLAPAGEGGALDTQDVTEVWFLIDEGICDETPVEDFILAGLGDGTPLEAFVLAPAPDDVGDQVAGSITEVWFEVDDDECDGAPLEAVDPLADATGIIWKYWTVQVASLGETWLEPDDGRVDTDPIEGFLAAPELECLLRQQVPPHTVLTFSYAL